MNFCAFIRMNQNVGDALTFHLVASSVQFSAVFAVWGVPVNSFTDISFIRVDYGKNAFWSGIFHCNTVSDHWAKLEGSLSGSVVSRYK